MTGLPTLLWHYARTRHGRRFSSRHALEAWQDRQVQALLARILPRSPFYRRQFGALPLAEWRRLPLLDKASMMANFDDLNTVGIRAEQAMAIALEAERSRNFSPTIGTITVGLSSGTSGNRGLFLVSPRERYAWAGHILARLLPGTLLDRYRIAFFLRANSNLYASVSSSRIRFEYHDLLDPLPSHLERLQTFHPDILVAPPSMLRLLAECRSRGQLEIAPSRLVSVAEVLDPLDEAAIRRSFALPVHQVYQCTEGFLAATCPEGTLHLNEDRVVIQKEIVDAEARKFIPIVTDFTRTTQPIIRYRLNDLLTERREPCACGSAFTALEAIEGRCDDIFIWPALAGGSREVFPDFIRRAVMLASEDIQEYRCRQVAPDRVEVAFRAPEAERARIEGRLAETFRELGERLGCRSPELHFTAYAFEPGDRKLRRVERAFPASGPSS